MSSYMTTDHQTGTVTLTIEPDLTQFKAELERACRGIQAMGYRMKGWHQAAEVVRTQEGARIVREGLTERLPWLRLEETP